MVCAASHASTGHILTVHMPNIEQGVIDARHLRNALGRFATGVTIITTRTAGGKREGLTANSFAAVSLDPPLISWSLKRLAPSFASFMTSRHFAVNVLSAGQRDLCRHFATPSHDKFADVEFEEGLHGAPIIPGCLATFECRTENTFAGGDHLIFIGRVDRATYRDGEPLIFSAGRLCVPYTLDETLHSAPEA
jgi:flavin reductase (DIM6/NTAB) family NADH-FMN oxidoreductase RutF